MATHSSVLAWRISGTGEPGGLPSVGSHRVGHHWGDLAAAAVPSGEGNGNSLQYSCLENPWTEEPGWATVHRIAKSRTRLSHFTSLQSPMPHTVKNLPAIQETRVPSLGQEDSPGEGNGYPVQYSCLENSMDRGTCQAAVHGVAKSWTQLSS